MSSILDALRKSEQERQNTAGQGISMPYPATIKYENNSRLIPVPLAIVVATCIGLAMWWAGFTAKDNKPAAVPPVSASPVALQPKPAVADSKAKNLPKRKDGARNERTAIVAPRKQPAKSPVVATPAAAPPVKPAGDPLQGMPPLDIAGFMHDEQGGNIAIINDRLLNEGDEVSPGLRVEKIKDDSVIFNYKGYVFSR